ncbi:MAG: response regulator transcription factor [Verrucomicrobiales bacterium]|nr:response regulator transcription factor [Verrucomicrobiales bacterium]
MSESRPVRVAIVDDHEMVRIGLRTMLERFPTLQVVGEAGTVAGAVDLARTAEPDVVLLDVRLGEESGFAACREIQTFERDVRVIVLTSYSDESAVFDAMAAGADAYLLKEIDGCALVKAIEEVARGEAVLDPGIVRVLSRVNRGEGAAGRGHLDPLSPQERRVLALVAEGKTNKEIAVLMGLSDKTVKNYFSRTLEKLGLSRRSQAAAYYIRHQYS